MHHDASLNIRQLQVFEAVARLESWTAPQKLDTQLSKVQFYG